MALLIEAMLLFNLGLIVVLLLRRPSQQLLGARASYGWWALPWLLAGTALTPTPLAPLLEVGIVAAPPMAQAAATATSIPWLLPLWGAGLLCCLVLALRSILQLRAQLKPTTQTIELAGQRLRVAHADFGPAVFGLWRAWLVMPEATAATLDAHDQRLALAHEGAHLRRRDLPQRLALYLACSLQWWNPLAWYAYARMLEDQELACDECVLSRYPGEARRYAALLARDPLSVSTASFVCSLQHPLIRRVHMLKRHPLSASHRLASLALVASAVLAMGAMAWAEQGADSGDTPDYYLALSLRAGDATAQSVGIGGREGEWMHTESEHPDGKIKLGYRVQAGPQADLVMIELSIEQNDQALGSPTLMAKLRESAGVSISDRAGNPLYTTDIVVLPWAEAPAAARTQWTAQD